MFSSSSAVSTALAAAASGAITWSHIMISKYFITWLYFCDPQNSCSREKEWKWKIRNYVVDRFCIFCHYSSSSSWVNLTIRKNQRNTSWNFFFNSLSFPTSSECKINIVKLLIASSFSTFFFVSILSSFVFARVVLKV